MNKIHSKGKRFFAPTIAAGLMLAMAFTLNACDGGGGGGGDDTPSSSSSGNGSLSSSSSGGGSLLPKCGGIEYNSDEKFCDERDENIYKYVDINGQVWMAENLNFEADGSRCYDDDTGGDSEGNCVKYGRLYNWNTAVDVCPSGWRLPSNEDWDKLFRFVDDITSTSIPYNSPTAGKYLKATSGWDDYEGISGNGTDAHGFSALPGGTVVGGNFVLVGRYGIWWSDSERDSDDHAYIWSMAYEEEKVRWNYDYKSALFSVRCLQD
ncbi:MAG: fibrobacter succinogenes major paralogous domain-containing protein [Fibromonadaceae bacterium]|jgi:uncharacterized protein (TIGR02145 family)|nr:fibrobacter succinogenes major paralogous domain-containing protein [Fibromonadaceae bacterium]